MFLRYLHIQYFNFKIVHGVFVLHKLPELASKISHSGVQKVFTHLTEKNRYKGRDHLYADTLVCFCRK